MGQGLLRLALTQLFQQWREQWQVLRLFGRRRSFLLPWLWLQMSYLLDGPYGVSRRYHKKAGVRDIYVYGETPLTTLDVIATRVGLSGEDHVFELGAGSGFTSLWLNRVKGCRVTAIEQTPVFCWRLQRLVKRFRLNGIKVLCADYLSCSLAGASAVYLYGSNLDEATIARLASQLAQLDSGVSIVTVSYPLQPYIQVPCFQLLDQFPARFEWGEADVFVQQVRRPEELKTYDERKTVC